MHTPLYPDRFDWHGCTAVQFDLKKLGGRATVQDTRMDADGVLLNYEGGVSVEDIAESFGVEREAVETILAFAAARNILKSA